MLVNLYRSKTPLSVFTLPLIVAVAGLPILLGKPVDASYFFDWQTELFRTIQNIPWLNYLLTLTLLSLNAHQLNNVFNRNTFYSKDTFLPGFIYVIGLITLDKISFSPYIVAHLFIIGALAALLTLKRQEPAKNYLFIGSLCIGCVFILAPVLFSLALLPWLALIIVRPFLWRDWVVPLLGMTLPAFYHFTIYFIATGELSLTGLSPKITAPEFHFDYMDYIVYSLMALSTLGGIFRLLSVMRNQLVSFKKISQIVLITLLLTSFSFVIGWLGFDQRHTGFLIPLGIIIGVQLLHNEKKLLSAILINCWFIVAFINLFLA